MEFGDKAHTDYLARYQGENPEGVTDEPRVWDPDDRTYVDSPADGSIYTLENGELIQYPKNADGSFVFDGGGAVDWERGLEPEDEPYMRGVEAMLRVPAFRYIREPVRSEILEDAKEMGAIVEVTLAADAVLIGWEGGSLEVYK